MPRPATRALETLLHYAGEPPMIVAAVVGLLLLFIDSKRPKSKPAEPGEGDHTAGDELFGEHDVERDLTRES